MKKLQLLLPSLILLLLMLGCRESIKRINIQPLGNVSSAYINLVKKSIKSFYGYEVVVLPKKEITLAMLSRQTKRIDADKALRSNQTSNWILMITERDICHYKDQARPEYGIFGYGAEPGKTAIISTFRLKRGVSLQKTLQRLEKVALHEIGHNLNLSHCSNHKQCMMNAANGTIKQVDIKKVWFCKKCTKKLNSWF